MSNDNPAELPVLLWLAERNIATHAFNFSDKSQAWVFVLNEVPDEALFTVPKELHSQVADSISKYGYVLFKEHEQYSVRKLTSSNDYATELRRLRFRAWGFQQYETFLLYNKPFIYYQCPACGCVCVAHEDEPECILQDNERWCHHYQELRLSELHQKHPLLVPRGGIVVLMLPPADLEVKDSDKCESDDLHLNH